MDQNKFPVWLNHPGFAPAILSGPNDPPGKPAQFPPVIVNNQDQFEEYSAKGYTFSAALVGAIASNAIDLEHEYPKWVRNVLCKNRDEEDRALSSDTMPQLELKSTLPSVAPALEDQLRDALVVRARAAGIEINAFGSA